MTSDGDSRRQPRGILGSGDELGELGVRVMNDAEAVELVKEKIRVRDQVARAVSVETGQPLPHWVGAD